MDKVQDIMARYFHTTSVSSQKLSEEVGINIAAVNKQLKQLTTKGYIQRTEKDGTWRLIITPSV